MNESAAVVRAFLARVFDDEDRGGRRSLAEYQREFPGHDEALARAWDRLAHDAGALGPFRLERELGRGGQGTVYLATDTRLERQVALKVLSGGWTESMRARFEREAKLASRVDHPHLASVLDVGVEGGTPWISMPFVEGRSLHRRIEESGALPEPLAVRLMAQATSALAAAHAVGVIHRDVKPANILTTVDEGQAVLTDFGVARDVEGGQTVTVAGEVIGTLHYTAPEVLQGQSADARSDVWSCGVTLFEAVTGRVPFDAPTRGGLVHSILREALPPLRVSADLAVVLRTALAKDPDDRYRSAAELAGDLQAITEHRPVSARPIGPLGRLTRWSRREPATAAAVCTAVVSLLAGLIVALGLLSSARAERNDKQTALGELERLADSTRLERLVGEIDGLQPPWPERVGELRDWLRRADELLATLGAHRVALARLTELGRSPTPEERAAERAGDPLTRRRAQVARNLEFLRGVREREGAEATGVDQIPTLEQRLVDIDAERAASARLRFDDDALRWRHESLMRLVAELDQFARDEPHGRTRACVARLLDQAQRLAAARREPTRHEAAWARARQDVPSSPSDPGASLVDQEGLVPLGPDPKTGLWEFACLLSGEPPTRDADGALQMKEASSIVYVLLPGGVQEIGASNDPTSPRHDPWMKVYEGPVVEVELAPFFISKFEVTQGQWRRLTGRSPSEFASGRQFEGHPKMNDLHPVESVSWDDAVATLRTIGAVLPTSAQWEYAARGGFEGAFPWGDTHDDLKGRANLADVALARVSGRNADPGLQAMGDDRWGTPAPVGSFEPNGFGLYDVCGNVQEWTVDVDYDARAAPEAGTGRRPVGDLSRRVLRGGSNLLGWRYARSAAIHVLRPSSKQYDHGVRPVRMLTK